MQNLSQLMAQTAESEQGSIPFGKASDTRFSSFNADSKLPY